MFGYYTSMILLLPAILLSVFFLLSRSGAMWFGIGAGGGVLAASLSISVYTLAKEKR